ncbi:unnamed protein product [Prorocentrum cordatum]|uniref:Uncharacterized protein n=1 Tax=Prorocentrum cordatum TaxID=2364126 RepID=A0ABN9X0L1_9DINO|nr:unnamed protein product [Polarella glacialis]|mmetsp:Transcript_50319/g.130663  ORF Transcript_50319/g.130663 Transcript_50319/m.130663 type:complete len:158 (-) Transcript_50319:55-528(-)
MFSGLPSAKSLRRSCTYPAMASATRTSDSQIVSSRSSSDTLAGSSPERGGRSQILMPCLLALVFAAVALGVLCRFGLVSLSGGLSFRTCKGRPATSSDYSRCEAWQDARTVLSLLIGVLLTSCGEGTLKRSQGDANSSSSAIGGGPGFTTMLIGMAF